MSTLTEEQKELLDDLQQKGEITDERRKELEAVYTQLNTGKKG